MDTQKVKALWVGGNKRISETFAGHFKKIDSSRLSLDMVDSIREALAGFSTHAFDVVFLDSSCIKGDDTGWQELKQISRLVPVVIVTKGDDQDLVFAALNRGAVDFIHLEDGSTHTILKTLRHALQSFKLISELAVAKKSDEVFKEQFLAAQKMESVGRLALGVAHDFNNLLTVILNYSEMVSMKANGDETLRNRMEAISNCANRAASITGQFLAFGRRNKPMPQAVSLTSIFSMVEPLLKQSLGSQIDLRMTENEKGLEVFIDPNHMMHVIMSMVQVAQDSMPEGGALSITSSNQVVDEEQGFELGGIVAGDYVVLSIKDNGMGFDSECVSHIFELFGGEKSDKSAAPALLYSINSMVKHSGGHIQLQSEVGKGSSFDIFLPRHMVEAPLAVEETKVEATSKSLETILIVDDEDMVRSIAVEVMTLQGYKVLEASSAIDALKLCEQTNAGVDLVLTDLIMPKMNGPELVRKMVAKNPHLRVVYMSGYSDDAFEHNEELETTESFVQKPFLPKSLIGAVKDALSKSPSLSE